MIVMPLVLIKSTLKITMLSQCSLLQAAEERSQAVKKQLADAEARFLGLKHLGRVLYRIVKGFGFRV